MKAEKILITGSTGFIGSHLTAVLKKKGHQVSAYKGDLRKKSELMNFVIKNKPNVVYHLGGVVDLSRSYSVARECIDINIKGTLNLLESLRNIKIKKFVYTSTEEVYGDNVLPYLEESLPHPPSPYAISKIASEQLIWLYSKEEKFEAYIFRIGTVYGPGQSGGKRLIPLIIDKALRNEEIPLNSGLKKRDYIYIYDVLEALTSVLSLTKRNDYEIINLGGGKQYSLRELVDFVLAISGSKSKPIYGAFPDRLLEADEWILDVTKAKKILGWRPSTTLSTGLEKTIIYHKKAKRSGMS